MTIFQVLEPRVLKPAVIDLRMSLHTRHRTQFGALGKHNALTSILNATLLWLGGLR